MNQLGPTEVLIRTLNRIHLYLSEWLVLKRNGTPDRQFIENPELDENHGCDQNRQIKFFTVSIEGNEDMKNKKEQQNEIFDFSKVAIPPHRSESDILGDLERVCTSVGYAHALAYICCNENFIMYSQDLKPDDLSKMRSPERLLRTEISLLTRMMVARPIDLTFPGPEEIQNQINSSGRLLSELHDAMNINFVNYLKTSSYDSDNSRNLSRDLALKEPIFYSGESAYYFQYRDFSALRYASDSQWLQDQYGFSPEHVVVFCDAIAELQQRNLQEIRKKITIENIDKMTFLPAFTCSFIEICSISRLEIEVVRGIARSFSPVSLPILSEYREIGSWNELSSRPIIPRDDNSFILFQNYCLAESAYESPFYWMLADKKYKNKAAENRGRFTEEFSALCLQKLFGPERVQQNVLIYDESGETVGEIDVLLLYADRAVILQAKSKRLTEAARRGVPGALQADFEKAVQTAYDQGYCCGEYLTSGVHKIVDCDGNELKINQRIREIFILCVVAEHFPGLSNYADQFIVVKEHSRIRQPYVIDVFMLDVICEMLDSPLYFFSFLNRRHVYAGRIKSSSEISILGYHLTNNLWFDDKMDFINIGDDFSAPIDAAMLARRDNIPADKTPTGILTQHRETYLGKLIQQIGRQESDNILDLGYLLLSLGEKAGSDISEAIFCICTRAQADGGVHDFSVAFEKCGLTVHSGYQDDGRTLEHLQSHCELSKYRSKLDTWFGLALSPFPIGQLRLAVGVYGEWKHTPELDQLVARLGPGYRNKNLKNLINTRANRRNKIGVNQPCPCGSGNKYKKCCMKTG